MAIYYQDLRENITTETDSHNTDTTQSMNHTKFFSLKVIVNQHRDRQVTIDQYQFDDNL